MSELRFMGVDDPETVRCRIYGGADLDEDERARRAFVAALATTGALDCPAYDAWVAALQAVGWLPPKPEYESADGGGRHARWRLTPLGHREWSRIGGGR